MVVNCGDYSTGKDDMALEVLKALCKSREEMIKIMLVNIINKYFDIDKCDSDCYTLTRSKEGFQYGTITIDDFEEFTEDISSDLADYIISKIIEIDTK